MTIRKPWRWTKLRLAIRGLLEDGRTPESIIKMMDDNYLAHYPDARISEKAMTLSGHTISVNAVAERIKPTSPDAAQATNTTRPIP